MRSLISLISFEISLVLGLFSLFVRNSIEVHIFRNILPFRWRYFILIDIRLFIRFLDQFQIFFDVFVEYSIIDDLFLGWIPLLFHCLFFTFLFFLLNIFYVLVLCHSEFMLKFDNFLGLCNALVSTEIGRYFFKVDWPNLFNSVESSLYFWITHLILLFLHLHLLHLFLSHSWFFIIRKFYLLVIAIYLLYRPGSWFAPVSYGLLLAS